MKELKKDRYPVYVFLDRIRSFYNVGSCFRTCDAANVEKLLLSEYTPFPPHKEISKTALGAEHTVPFEHTHDPVNTLTTLRERGVRLVAVDTGSDTVPYTRFTPVFPICLVFGNEISGISREILELCDDKVSIPMHGIKESLNVSVAVGIVLFDIVSKFKAEKTNNL